MTYLPLADDHSLVITPEDGLPAMCDCGATFDGGPEMQAAAWRDHVEVEGLKMAARGSAIAEYVARAAWEDAVKRLLDHGLTSGDISAAIGNHADGRPMVSRTLIQRLGRGEYATTPRRRRA